MLASDDELKRIWTTRLASLSYDASQSASAAAVRPTSEVSRPTRSPAVSTLVL